MIRASWGRREDDGRLGSRPTIAGSAAIIILSAAPAIAQVPQEFWGRWSSNPPRCEQVNGEVNVLTVDQSSLSYYEIGCEQLTVSRRGPAGILTFEAACFKGGIPDMKGLVQLSRSGTDTIHVKLLRFPWIAPTVQTFHLCRSQE